MVKSTKVEIDDMKDKLTYKIYDVITIDSKNYFLDKQSNLIWDENVEIVGFIKNDVFIFWQELDLLMEKIKHDWFELENINKKIENFYIT